MKAAQFRDLRSDELGDKLEGLQKKLFELRSQAVTEKVENTCSRQNVKRDIARIKTIMRENELKSN